MLIVSRREGQAILIGDDIEITISRIRRSTVKLAIKAPRQLLVQRVEVAAPGDDESEPDGGTPR